MSIIYHLGLECIVRTISDTVIFTCDVGLAWMKSSTLVVWFTGLEFSLNVIHPSIQLTLLDVQLTFSGLVNFFKSHQMSGYWWDWNSILIRVCQKIQNILWIANYRFICQYLTLLTHTPNVFLLKTQKLKQNTTEWTWISVVHTYVVSGYFCI